MSATDPLTNQHHILRTQYTVTYNQRWLIPSERWLQIAPDPCASSPPPGLPTRPNTYREILHRRLSCHQQQQQQATSLSGPARYTITRLSIPAKLDTMVSSPTKTPRAARHHYDINTSYINHCNINSRYTATMISIPAAHPL